MPPYRRCRRHYVSDCPSIRMSVRPDFFQLRDKYNYLMEFHQIWSSWMWQLNTFWARSAQRQGSKVNHQTRYRGSRSRWTDFGRDPPNVKGQWTWSEYAIFNSLKRILKNPWVDFHQTWYMDAPLGVDELVRFWARSAKGQWTWSKIICYFSLVNSKFQEPLSGFSSNLVQGCTTESRWTE